MFSWIKGKKNSTNWTTREDANFYTEKNYSDVNDGSTITIKLSKS